jgi:hypothetical protein
MNDEKKKSESFTNLIFGSSVWNRLPGKGNHTDDDRRNELLRHEHFLVFAFSLLHFFFYSSHGPTDGLIKLFGYQ